MAKMIGRKVEMARTHIDPVLPGMGAKNAFDMDKIGAVSFTTEIGVYVKVKLKDTSGEYYTQEHIIPYSNIQALRLGKE